MNSRDAAAQCRYVHVGRWTLCAHCRTGYAQDSAHYCGAPWQAKPADWPEGWKVGEPDEAERVRDAYERGARDLADWLDDQDLTDYAMDELAERFLTSCSADGAAGKVEG